jgi:hypothetical protein
MRELLARHIELDYAGLVRGCQNRQPGRVDGMEPVTQRSAYRYIAAVFKGLFTPAILGSEHNQAVLLRREHRTADQLQVRDADCSQIYACSSRCDNMK